MKSILSPLYHCFVTNLLVAEYAAYPGRCKITLQFWWTVLFWLIFDSSQSLNPSEHFVARSCQEEWNLVNKNEIKSKASRPNDSWISNAKTVVESLHSRVCVSMNMIITADIETGWRELPCQALYGKMRADRRRRLRRLRARAAETPLDSASGSLLAPIQLFIRKPFGAVMGFPLDSRCWVARRMLPPWSSHAAVSSSRRLEAGRFAVMTQANQRDNLSWTCKPDPPVF